MSLDSFPVDWLGYAATGISISSFVPQAFKAWSSDELDGLSHGTAVMTVFGFSIWLSYAILKGDGPLVASNALCLFLSGTILMALVVRIGPRKFRMSSGRRKLTTEVSGQHSDQIGRSCSPLL